MKRLLRVGRVRWITFPRFEHGSLESASEGKTQFPSHVAQTIHRVEMTRRSSSIGFRVRRYVGILFLQIRCDFRELCKSGLEVFDLGSARASRAGNSERFRELRTLLEPLHFPILASQRFRVSASQGGED
jgi:hypothetical protein